MAEPKLVSFRGFSFSTLLVISPSPFPGLAIPRLLDSSLSSLLFTSFLHDLQPLLSGPRPWDMMRNDS